MRNTLLLLFWLVPTVLWLLGVTRWRRRIVDGNPPGSPMWFWLRAFGIPESPANRARLLVVTSIIGITVVTIVVGLLWGLE
jgi:hypothetical protein